MVGVYFVYQRVSSQAEEATANMLDSAIGQIFTVFDSDRLTRAQLRQVNDLALTLTLTLTLMVAHMS